VVARRCVLGKFSIFGPSSLESTRRGGSA